MLDYYLFEANPGISMALLPDAPQFTIAAVSNDFVLASGVSREDAVGKGLFEFFFKVPGDPDCSEVQNLRAALTQLLIDKSSHELLVQHYTIPNGNRSFCGKYWRANNVPVLNKAEELVYIIQTLTDVTAFVKTAKGKLGFNEYEERFRMMANSIPQLAWMTDAKGWIYWYNDRWYNYTGTTPEEMLGWGWKKVHHPDLVEGVVKRFKAAIEAGTPWEDTFLLRSKEGEYHWFLSRSVPVRKEDGTLIGWFGTNTDVTGHRRTEEALKKSEEQLLLAMDGGELGFYDYNPITGELIWSARTKELFGLPPDAKVDYNIYLNALYPEDRERIHEAIQNAFRRENGGRYESEYRVIGIRDGRLRWLRSKGKAFFDEYEKAYRLAGVTMDITKQKEAEEAIAESHREFQFVMDFVPQIIWLTWPDGYHYYFNKQWYDYTGETKGEKWVNVLHPDDPDRILKFWRHSLDTGDPYEVELRIRRYDGQYRWFLARALPLKDESGTIIKWFGTCTDIHDQKTFSEVLEKLVEERTKELQRSNEDLQQFAHVASHDLKEPVRKIKTFVSKVQEELNGKLDETSGFYLERVQAAASRMFSMIDGVLTYSTIGALEEIYEPVDLNQVIKNVEFDLEMAIHQKNATIHYKNLLMVEGAPFMLHQVFYNLISNSLKFAGTDQAPIINITSALIDQKGKAFARIMIADNGIGFDQKDAEKIFGTFIRLNSKDKYEGAGLGLSLCKKIIERHGGSISAKSKENEGAIFQIDLPVNRPAA
ncbi:MAG TPA: PAS domain-containing protein [Niastella sp.]